MAGRPKKAIADPNVKTEPSVVSTIGSEPKIKLKLNDSVSLTVVSNVFGELIYVNHKTGDKYTWDNMGDTQTLYVSDIRAMKSNQRRFLEENWIVVTGIADISDEYDTVDINDIYEALQISQYYKEFLCPTDLNDVFNWTATELRKKVSQMPRSTKESIAIRANELIKEGILDSRAKIKTLEEVIGCELATEDDN